MKLVWTTRAKTHPRDIVLHIGADNPAAAKKIRGRVETLAAYLKSLMGRMGAIAGTREAIPHPSYRIVYQVTDETVSILRAVHTARQWPPDPDRVEDDT